MKLTFKNKARKFCIIPQTPGTKIMGIFGNKRRVDIRKIKFDESCTYNGDINDKAHILFGFNFGKDRVYVGWKYSPLVKRIELYLVTENNEKYAEQSLFCNVHFNTSYIIYLSVDWGTGKIVARAEPTLNRLTIPIETVTHLTDSNLFRFFDVCLSTGMLPRLRNMKSKPDSKMKLSIEKV